MKISIWLLFFLCVTILSYSPVAHGMQATSNLPPEGQAALSEHKLLFQTAARYKANTRKLVNTQEEMLLSIDFASPGQVNGEMEVPLPPDIALLWRNFHAIELAGDAYDFAVGWRSADGKSGELKNWRREGTTSSFRASGAKFGPDFSEGITIVLKGTGRVETLRMLLPGNGRAQSFDDSPYVSLGADKPILPVRVTLDATKRRSIGGISTFERHKYFRLYANPSGGPGEALKYLADRDFPPGRQIFKFGPALEVGHSEVGSQPHLREDKNRPGYADLSFFEQPWDHTRAIDQERQFQGIDYAVCFDDWPSWMWATTKEAAGARGTPAADKFDAAAELAVATVSWWKRAGRLMPKWIEVKNESDIISEWGYHAHNGKTNYDGRDVIDSWALLGEFSNKLADAIKREHPDIKIVGPASAWPAMSRSNFTVGRNHLRFIDLTKGHLDGYSYHFYENKKLMLEDRIDRLADQSYLLGEMQNTLDLLRAHMHATENVKPLLITEYGSLWNSSSDLGQWMPLRNYSAYMTQFLDRPDQFDLCVPFFLPVMWWERNATTTLFLYNNATGNDSELTLSRQKHFLDLWSPYRGDLIAIDCDTPDLNVHAVRDGKTVQVVLSNMNSQRATVDLRAALGNAKVVKAEQRRLYFEQGKLVWEVVPVFDLTMVPVAVEETSIVSIELSADPGYTSTQFEQRHYGDKVIQPTGKPIDFSVAIVPLTTTSTSPTLVAATLRVGLHRNGGFEGTLRATVNGQLHTVDLSHTNGIGVYNDFIEIDLPTTSVQSVNTITIDLPQPEGSIQSISILTAHLK